MPETTENLETREVVVRIKDEPLTLRLRVNVFDASWRATASGLLPSTQTRPVSSDTTDLVE